ncbi:MAG: hypothetical protein Q7R41_06590 [Phycisphaerales bacterium]|nr:hypothetical protein [Phycisphaerales bacterium]
MSTRELRRQAGQRLKSLSPQRLQVAADFLAYLEERESNQATEELLRIPGVVKQLNEAKNGVSKRKSVNWRKVRRDV